MFSDYNEIKQEINIWKINVKSSTILRLNSIFQNSTLVKDDVTKEILKHFDLNKYWNMTDFNVWCAMQAVLKVKFIVLSLYFRKEEKISKIKNITFHLGKTEK